MRNPDCRHATIALLVAAGILVSACDDLTRFKQERYECNGNRHGLVEIDFRSMEPNLLLAWQGRPTYLDLYSALAEEVFDGKLSRTKVKLSVIASLYNSERSNKHAKAIAEFF